MAKAYEWLTGWLETWRIAPPFSQRRRDILEALRDADDPDAWVQADRPHRHEWEVDYFPDPISGGGVVRSGLLVCRTCGAEVEDQ